MQNHNVEVYTNKEEICGGLGFEPNVNKVIEIDDEIMIIYYDDGLIGVWNDEDIQYFYKHEFSLEKYL